LISTLAVLAGGFQIAKAVITSPVPTTANPGNIVKGAVPVTDDYFNAANPAQTCTSSLFTGGSTKGITTVEIFQGGTATGTPVLKNNFVNTLKGTLIPLLGGAAFDLSGMTGSLAATWTTDTSTATAPRGLYTIRTSYFKRTTTAGACGAAANCAASTPVGFGTLTNAFPGCVANSVVGASEGIPASTRVVDVQNQLAVAISNAPASGPYLASDAGPTTVTVQARLTDPGRAGVGINGKTVSFALAGGPSGTQTLTGVTATKVVGSVLAADQGFASVTFDVAGWSFGSHPLTVSGPPTDTQFLTAAPATNAIKFGGASVTSYTGPANVYWDDVLAAAGHVQAQAVGGGAPADGGMKFTVGTGTSAITDTVASVDAAGNAGTNLHVTLDPPSAPLRVDYLGSSDQSFLPSFNTSTLNILKRPTTITYTGDSTKRYGDDTNVEATLVDTLRNTPLVGRTIHFTLGSTSQDAVTDSTGKAKITVPALSDVGTYTVSAAYSGDNHYVDSSITKPFTVDFRYLFQTVDRFIDLNPGTHQLGYRGPEFVSGIRRAPLMFSVFLPTQIKYPVGPALPTIPENLLYNLLQLPTLPQVNQSAATPTVAGMLNSLGVPTAGARSSDPAMFPIPIGGVTVGQLLNMITSKNLPTDLSVCQVLYDSPCERRLTVLTYPGGNFTLTGLFDIKTGVFAAVKTQGLNVKILGNLSGCTSDPTNCLQLPAGPGGLPTVPSAPSVPPVPPVPAP
jgi:hypothetical protein